MVRLIFPDVEEAMSAPLVRNSHENKIQGHSAMQQWWRIRNQSKQTLTEALLPSGLAYQKLIFATALGQFRQSYFNCILHSSQDRDPIRLTSSCERSIRRAVRNAAERIFLAVTFAAKTVAAEGRRNVAEKYVFKFLASITTDELTQLNALVLSGNSNSTALDHNANDVMNHRFSGIITSEIHEEFVTAILDTNIMSVVQDQHLNRGFIDLVRPTQALTQHSLFRDWTQRWDVSVLAPLRTIDQNPLQNDKLPHHYEWLWSTLLFLRPGNGGAGCRRGFVDCYGSSAENSVDFPSLDLLRGDQPTEDVILRWIDSKASIGVPMNMQQRKDAIYFSGVSGRLLPHRLNQTSVRGACYYFCNIEYYWEAFDDSIEMHTNALRSPFGVDAVIKQQWSSGDFEEITTVIRIPPHSKYLAQMKSRALGDCASIFCFITSSVEARSSPFLHVNLTFTASERPESDNNISIPVSESAVWAAMGMLTDFAALGYLLKHVTQMFPTPSTNLLCVSLTLVHSDYYLSSEKSMARLHV